MDSPESERWGRTIEESFRDFLGRKVERCGLRARRAQFRSDGSQDEHRTSVLRWSSPPGDDSLRRSTLPTGFPRGSHGTDLRRAMRWTTRLLGSSLLTTGPRRARNDESASARQEDERPPAVWPPRVPGLTVVERRLRHNPRPHLFAALWPGIKRPNNRPPIPLGGLNLSICPTTNN